jgi:hypothetical protein
MSDAEPLTVMSEDIIINGNTAGITVPMQRDIPLFMYSADIGEKRVATAITPTQNIGDM